MPRERTDLHPAERTRRRALAAVRGTVRFWAPSRRPSRDDCADAVSEALSRAIAAGWAERPGAWWYVKHKALRALRGWQRVAGGRVHSARGGATPTAGPALWLFVDGEGRWVKPDTWIAERAVADAPRERQPPGWRGDLDLLRAEGWSSADLARELGVSRVVVARWASGGATPTRGGVRERLAALAADLRAALDADLGSG